VKKSNDRPHNATARRNILLDILLVFSVGTAVAFCGLLIQREYGWDALMAYLMSVLAGPPALLSSIDLWRRFASAGPRSGQTDGEAADRLADAYLARQAEQTQILPIEAIFGDAQRAAGAKARRILLARIYVPMDLADLGELDPEAVADPGLRKLSFARDFERIVPVTDALARGIDAGGPLRAVLIGEAGAGKSSVVADLIHRCAHDPDFHAALRGRTLLRFKLEDLAEPMAALPAHGLHDQALVDRFWQIVAEHIGMAEGEHDLAVAAAGRLRQRLRQRGLLLLDGLDEVLDPAARALTARLVAAVGNDLDQADCPLLVTARPYVYPDCALDAFQVWRLLPLDSNTQIPALVRNWYRALEIPEGQASHLLAALTGTGDGARAEMATRPLLLTLLIAVALERQRKDPSTPLPEDRAELIEAATELFVKRWFERVGQVGRGRLSAALIAALTEPRLRQVLERVSLAAQRGRPELDGAAEVTVEVAADAFLRPLLHCLPTAVRGEAEQAERLILERAGLLFARGPGPDGERYGFVHRQFQEYLAACALVAEDAGALEHSLGEPLRHSPGAWREVVRFAVLRLQDDHGAGEAIDLVRALLFEDRSAAACDDACFQKVVAAGLALEDLHKALTGKRLTPHQQAELADAKARLDRWYQRLVSDPAPAPRTRLDLGRIAGRLGDPRPKIVPTGWTPDPEAAFLLDPKQDFDWVQIPTGRFRPGSDEAEQDAFDDEYGGQPVDLPGFAITRVPITCGQFAAFSRGGGYGPTDGPAPQWWAEISDQAVAWWHGQNPGLEQYCADPDFKQHAEAYRRWVAQRKAKHRRRPWFEGDPRYADWLLPNHPLIGVSWYEAMAFCGWLTAHWRDRGLLADNELIRLPTEIEWERAARGLARRRWPWGDHWRPGAANTEEAEVQATTAVGLFPAASPEGLLDMAGNVWEWTTTRWGPTIGEPAFGWPWKPDDERDDPRGTDLRVVRGGSWTNTPRACRCAFRGWDGPDLWNDDLGFRVARVSLAHSDF
jgi:formylglycine-generating enzyme required for sulfatase activity